jgi:phosphoribosylanthranilate isomerase
MEVEHAVVAAAAGADFIGMVFAPSRRRISPERAATIVASVQRVNPRPACVGLFADMPVSEVDRIAGECGLDYVQLTGAITPGQARAIVRPVIRSIHVASGATAASVLEDVRAWHDAMAGRPGFRCLLDSGSPEKGIFGGTGKTFDWSIAREVAARYPVIAAGGLTPENVGQLVREVRPWGVDVASGVETDGRKDPHKIEAFIRAVWNAE